MVDLVDDMQTNFSFNQAIVAEKIDPQLNEKKNNRRNVIAGVSLVILLVMILANMMAKPQKRTSINASPTPSPELMISNEAMKQEVLKVKKALDESSSSNLVPPPQVDMKTAF